MTDTIVEKLTTSVMKFIVMKFIIVAVEHRRCYIVVKVLPKSRCILISLVGFGAEKKTLKAPK